MIILISNSSEKPIYQQIAEQIKEQILSKELADGDMLPSIRSLARELKISVITTKKAYTELERERFVETVPGKGTFVAKANLEYLKEMRMRRVEEHLTSALKEAKTINLNFDELVQILKILSEE